MKKPGNSHVAGGNVKCYRHSGREFGSFLKILSIQLSHDPATAFLGIYIKEMKTYNHTKTCTWMFIGLFIRAKTWRRPKCPSTGEWLNKLLHIHNMELLLSNERESTFQQPGWISRESCWVKKSYITKRLYTVWFHLYNILEMTFIQRENKSVTAAVKKEVSGRGEMGVAI